MRPRQRRRLRRPNEGRHGADSATGPLLDQFKDFIILVLIAAAEVMVGRGLRVLALASRVHESIPAPTEIAKVETDMCLVELVGLIDPPRPESAFACADR